MPLNRNTMMRIRTIDACLQRRYRKWTLEDLRQACEDALAEYEGIPSVSIRTVQRDIELMRSDKLGYNAPIIVRERKYYCYEDSDFSLSQLPLTEQDVVQLSQAMDIIRQYQNAPQMAGSGDALVKIQDRISSNGEAGQIIFIETNKRLPGLEYIGTLYEACKNHQQLLIDYRSFKGRRDTPQWISVSPYVLKEFNNRWFLVAYHRRMKVITIALDRMCAIENDKEAPFTPNTFCSPEEYFGAMVGVTRGLNDMKQKIVIKVNADQAPYVLTKPFHESQQHTMTFDDGSILVELNVIHNLELERLLLGYAEHIEIIAPRLIRHRMAVHLIAAAAKYQAPAPEVSADCNE